MSVFRLCRSPVVACHRVPLKEVSKYGVIRPGRWVSRIVAMVNSLIEKPAADQAPSDMVLTGRYVLTPEIFDALEDTAPGSGGEIQLTDALSLLCKDTRRGAPVYACLFEGKPYHVGDPVGLLTASIELALARDDLKEHLAERLSDILKRGL